MWLLTYLFQNSTVNIQKFILNLKGAIKIELTIMHLVKPDHFQTSYYILIRSSIVEDTSISIYLQTNNSQYRL